ncbi:MAG: hypothetical protein U0V70_07835 [Terriglobia bacterium]
MIKSLPEIFPGLVGRLRKSLSLLCVIAIFSLPMAAQKQGKAPQFQSGFIRVKLSGDQPAFVDLVVDSLGKKKLDSNPLRPPAASQIRYEVTQAGAKSEYRPLGASHHLPPVWSFEFSEKFIHLISNYSPAAPAPTLTLNFDLNVNRATLLGLLNPDHTVRLPALLHMPVQGTLRITSTQGKSMALGYDAFRHPIGQREKDFMTLTFPAASASRPQIDYTLEVVAIYPEVAGINADPRFDGFRRGWLNIFQINPRVGVLANSSNGGACPFCQHEFSAVAVKTPPLAPGLTALDLVRQSLDMGLKDVKDYVQHDPSFNIDFLDTYPSLLIAASDYVRGSNDDVWLNQNYAGIKGWATKLLDSDTDGDGLIEYVASGNSGSWGEFRSQHPANWWDSIGFGHKDAYSNALAYHGLLGMAELARRTHHPDDADLYAARAEKLKSIYYPTFFNPLTGVLAGWKSLDGKLHDYYFTFVSAMAITYDLIPADKANGLMDHLLAKMHEVGYTQFQYGLPGNLIPVLAGDFLDPRQVWGGGGQWGFQWYENGGATAAMVYYTLEALYKLGRREQADAILFPMLRSYEEGVFQGTSTYLVDGRTRTYDWRRWDGEPCGYEGLLTDDYLALLSVLSR